MLTNVHMIRNPDDSCNHTKGYTGFLESFSIPSEETMTDGYPSTEGAQPVFKLGASSKDNFTLTLSSEV